MTTKTEDLLDNVIERIERALALKSNPTKALLDNLRDDLITIHGRVQQMQQRMAFMERDERETWRMIGVLKAAGALTDEQVSEASNIVYEARGQNNTFTDVETILKNFDVVFKIGD